MSKAPTHVILPAVRFREGTGKFSTKWRAYELQDLADFSSGNTPSKSILEYWHGDFPWITAKDLKSLNLSTSELNLSEKGVQHAKIAPKGATLILVRGMSLLKRLPLGIARRELAFNQDIKSLVPDTAIINEKFLTLLLLKNRDKVLNLVSVAGHGTGRLDTESLKSSIFKIPPLPEQQKIANFLTTVDKRIELLENKKAKLDEYKKGLLQKLFPKKDTALPELRFKRDDGGEFGGWDRKKLSTLATIQTGIAKNSKLIERTIEMPYLRVANVQDGYFDLSELKTIKVPTDKIEKYRVKKGDLLLTEGGDFDKLGRGAVWNDQINGCIHQNHVFAVRPNNKLLSSKFIALLTGSQYGKRYFLSCSKQTTNLASINSTQLKDFPVILPTLPEQQKIADFLTSVDKKIERLRRLQIQIFKYILGVSTYDR